MSWLEDMPLKRKLTLVILATCGIVLSLASLSLAIYEYMDFRSAMARDSATVADILGKTTHAALTFEDADEGRDILKSLEHEPDIMGARLFDGKGKPFADFTHAHATVSFPENPASDGYKFSANHLGLFRGINWDGRSIGTIYLQVDLHNLYDRLDVFAGAAVIVLTASLLLGLFLSTRLQRLVSTPILTLAETARMVADRRDYSVRAPAQGKNEMGVLTDAFNHMLTQIQEQNQDLQEGEGRVRSILNSALSAVVVFNDLGVIIDWNSRAESIFGWTRAEALGREVVPTIIPHSQQGVALAELLPSSRDQTGGALIEMNVLRRNGEEFPVEVSISTLTTRDQVNHCGFFTDITDRKQANSRIQAQISRLDLLNQITRAIADRLDLPSIFQVVVRSLEDNLPVDFACVCRYDQVSKMLTVTSVGLNNEALAMELSLPEKAVIDCDSNGLSRCIGGTLVYEPDISGIPLAFQQRLVNAGVRALVVAPLVVESTVFGVLIAGRRQVHSFSSAECEFLRQLSEQVALASHQAQLYGALQQAYDDLRQSQQTVLQQERLRALGQMASGIAHDINNAISPVALYTESLLEIEKNLSPRARKYLETIKCAIEDVAHTVARMREFYRPREPQLTLAAVDLNQMVEQVMDLTRARWSDMPQQRGIVIKTTTTLATGIPEVMGIASEIREALINLVFNAIDAMPEGGELTVRTCVVDDPPGQGEGLRPAQVCLEVVDTGSGMDEETRRKCLEPFYTTKGERGTGLGLAMVYGIMQRHNAGIEIESAVGKGTTMRLAFPLTSVPECLAAPIGADSIPGRLRILIVDDDPILLKSLRDILESDDHDIVTANQGQGGIDAFRSAFRSHQPFELVITDLGMPYVDGRKVAAAIKETSPTTPVILLTGWGQRMMAEGDIPAHVDCLLSKPPKLRELRDAITRCSGSRRVAESGG